MLDLEAGVRALAYVIGCLAAMVVLYAVALEVEWLLRKWRHERAARRRRRWQGRG